MTRHGREREDGDGDGEPVADVESSEYPIDHDMGYAPVPRDLANFEPVMHEPSGVCLRVLVVIMARVRHAPGWARGSHGPVWLERGQCIAGEHDLAERIGVGRKAARRTSADQWFPFRISASMAIQTAHREQATDKRRTSQGRAQGQPWGQARGQ